jgi:hypothetical protein
LVHSILVDERERGRFSSKFIVIEWFLGMLPMSFLVANANNVSATSDEPWALNKILINLKQY